MCDEDVFDVPNGKVAGVITHLSWRPTGKTDRPVPRDGFRLARRNPADPDWYRALFRKVGQDWLWTSRLGYSDAKLAEHVSDPNIEIYALGQDDEDVGLLELSFHNPLECEISLFGLAPPVMGKGLGPWLMQHAKTIAIERGVTHLHLNTCTFDSPKAIPFYLSQGLVATKRQVEMFDDPRLSGQLARNTAQHIPIIE